MSAHRKERRAIALEMLTTTGMLTETATRLLSPDWELDDVLDAASGVQRHIGVLTDAQNKLHDLADQIIREEHQ